MAIKINVALTDQSGRAIPSGSVITADTYFPKPILNIDEASGDWDGTVTRPLEYGLPLFTSVADLQALKGVIEGGCTEFPALYPKIMTQVEYDSLSGPDALLTVETWLKDWLEAFPAIGVGNCEIIDPYV